MTELKLVLSDSQKEAANKLQHFLLDSTKQFIIINGFAGTGKTTLLKHIKKTQQDIYTVKRMIQPDFVIPNFIYTATTTFACENLSNAVNDEVHTLDSFLHLRVKQTPGSYRTQLYEYDSGISANDDPFVLFIDEISTLNQFEIDTLLDKVKGKIVLLGDAYQLLDFEVTEAPIFNMNIEEITLTENMRTEAPILNELCAQFREQIDTGKRFTFTPDHDHIQILSRQAFDAELKREYNTNPQPNIKMLAYKNNCVIGYNKLLHNKAAIEEEDIVINNAYFPNTRHRDSIRNNARLQIKTKTKASKFGIDGHYYLLNNGMKVFMPDDINQKKELTDRLIREKKNIQFTEVQNTWIDLRLEYACTVHKSQGSTYDRAYIDLDNISECYSPEQIPRLLYVATSRCKYQAIFTGKLYK